MKLFVYKSLVIFCLIFILYHLTLGYQMKKLKSEFYNFFDKEKISYIKLKIRDELKNAQEKETLLNKQDAILIRDFIKKLNKELNIN